MLGGGGDVGVGVLPEMRIRICMNPRYSKRPDPDSNPHYSEKLDPATDPYL